MKKSWQISRRTMLRGVGASVALPWLEAMSTVAQSKTTKPPLRMVFVYHPLGAETTAWKGVTGEGTDMKLTTSLQPLELACRWVPRPVLAMCSLACSAIPKRIGDARAFSTWLRMTPAN